MTTVNINALIQCDIHKVWDTISTVDQYHTWRSDVDKTEFTGEKQFIEYSKTGYPTTFTVTVAKPQNRWELDVENSQTTGHWTVVLTPKGSATEIDITAGVTAKKLSLRPIGKSVFEQTYLKKMQTQFIADLKKSLE